MCENHFKKSVDRTRVKFRNQILPPIRRELALLKPNDQFGELLKKNFAILAQFKFL